MLPALEIMIGSPINEVFVPDDIRSIVGRYSPCVIFVSFPMANPDLFPPKPLKTENGNRPILEIKNISLTCTLLAHIT
jgi:hypothetical protein